MRFINFIFSRLFICFLIIAAIFAAIIFLCVYIHSLLPAAAALCLFTAINAITALHIVASESPAEFKCGWLVIVACTPLMGAAAYLLTRPCRPRKEETAAVKRASYSFIEYLKDGETYLKRLTDCVAAANERIALEYYIIADGKIWRGIYSALCKAAERGVKIYIVYDGVGSATRAPKKNLKALKKRGAAVRVFHKPAPLPIAKLNVRNHRKLAVIDGETAFIGGVNIADEYAEIEKPHGVWKDGGAIICGNAAHMLEEEFLKTFKIRLNRSPHDSEEGRALIVSDSPNVRGALFEDVAAALFYGAKDRIFIFTPYLCLGEKLFDALCFARSKGADVKIIIPAVPDKKLPYAVTLTYAERLIIRGVEVYAYTPGFLHLKATVCDNYAYIGSYNFDYRSMRFNRENGIVCGGELAKDIERDFIKTLECCKKVTLSRDSAFKRLKDGAVNLFAPLV